MKNVKIILVTIGLLIVLLTLAFVPLHTLIQNSLFFICGIVGAGFVFKYFFQNMTPEEKKNWEIKFPKKTKKEDL